MTRSDTLTLRRISHRLVMTRDGDLPEILLALLPRILQRMHRTESRIDARVSEVPSSQERLVVVRDIDTTEETNIQIVCKEIVTHAIERVRGLEETVPTPWISEVASFLSSACTLDSCVKNSELSHPCRICDSRILALDLLQEGILRLYKLGDFNNEIISRILTATLQAVDWFHASSSISIHYMEGLFKASWIVLDSIAIGNQFPPLFAFNFYLCEAKFKSKRRLGPVPSISPSKILQDAAATFGVGMFNFFLDVILFHPDLSNTADYNFERWMRQRSILTQHSLRTSLQQRGTNTMISHLSHHPQSSSEDSGRRADTSNMNYRLHYRANSDKITSSEEILKETRCIKLSCYRYASLLFNDAENVASVQRALLLAIIARSDQYLCTEVKAQFRSLLSTVQKLRCLRNCKSEGKSGNDPMVGLLSSLFILILGKEKVDQLRQNMHLDSSDKRDWENILGPISLLQSHELSLASVSSVLEFTLEQLSVSPWWQNIYIDQEEEENKNTEFLLHLLFEVAEEAVGLTHFDSFTGEDQISPQLWQKYLHTEEAKRCALGAGILRYLSRKLMDNPTYKKKFHNYFDFLCRIIGLITSMYCVLLACENEHPNPPSRIPDVSYDDTNVIGDILESQLLSAPARFRGECYHAIGCFISHCGDYVPTLNDPTFYKLPGNLLICLMAEEDDILREIIAMSLHKALQAYEEHLAQDPRCATYRESSFYLSDILPILLAASCSYNSIVRIFVVRCLSGIVRFFDPSISYNILTLFAEDNSPEVRKASVEAISQLGQSAASSSFLFPYGREGTLNCISTEALKIRLSCLHVGSCSSCGESSHHPAMCTDISKWKALNGPCSLEKRSLDFPKRCAGCNATITKDQGCSHLKCRKCNVDTCSLCLKRITPFSTHACGEYKRNQAEEIIFCLHMYQVYSTAEKFACEQLRQFHNVSNVQLPPYLILRVNDPIIEQSIYTLIACRNFLKNLSVRLYFYHKDTTDQNYETGEQPTNRIRALHAILQVFVERLGKLTELENEEEIMSYGIAGIPLFLRSLKVYTLISLEVMHQLEVIIERMPFAEQE